MRKRIGIYGAADEAFQLIPMLLANPGVEITAVVDPGAPALRARRNTYDPDVARVLDATLTDQPSALTDDPALYAVIDAGGELAMVVPPPSLEETELRRKLSSLPSAADIAALPAMTERALAMDIGQTLFWGQLGRKLYDLELYEESLAVFQRRSALLEEMQSEWVVSAYGWQGLLLDLLGRREEALAIYRKALEHEVDREFAYDGDPVTIQRAWLQERLETPFTRPEG